MLTTENRPELQVACAKHVQYATFPENQPDSDAGESLKSLADAALRKLHERNSGKKPRNFEPQNKGEKLREVAHVLSDESCNTPRNSGATAPPYWRVVITRPDGRRFEVDSPSGMTLEEAGDFARDFHGEGCEVSGLVLLVDADRDQEAELPSPFAENAGTIYTQRFVTCAACQHATKTDHAALIDCAERVPSPAAVGPFTRWKTDRHECDQYEVKPCTP